MYRSRPKGDLGDDVLSFLSSIKTDESILYYDIVGSEAHSIMLHEMGHITKAELKKVLGALEEAKKDPGRIAAGAEGFEDIHEALEAFVIKRAGMSAGGKMHTARSRNDQVVLDIRMKLRDDINGICAAIAGLIDALAARAAQTKSAPMPMYTHLQQAQIGTFSHFLLSYADALLRDLERLYLSYQRVNLSPLGACAIGGSSLAIDRKRTAVLLGFAGLMKNSVDATSARDSFLEYVSALAILMTTLARMAEDFIIWSTTEFGYIELADRYSSTSSAMPQKKNPDPLELTRAKAALVLGNLVAMLATVRSLPSGYSRDLQDLKLPLLEASRTAVDAVRIMAGVIGSLQVRKERMQEAANSSYAIALDVAEQLVAKKGMPFRSAHKVVGELVGRAARRGNVPLAKLARADFEAALKAGGISGGGAGEQAGGQKTAATAQDLMSIVKEMTPARSLALRRSSGSPNQKEQEEMISEVRRKAANYRIGIEKRARLVRGSFDSLERLVQEHLDK